VRPVCPCCQKPFTPYRHVPDQRYCEKRGCQRARKREWERRKLAADPDYRATRVESQRTWLESRTDYWREYRASHPEAADRNRERQRERNRRRRHPPDTPEAPPEASVIAKTDAYPSGCPDSALPSGRYALVFVGDESPGLIAKKDVFAWVELHVLPLFSPDASPDCKEGRVPLQGAFRLGSASCLAQPP
jgi:hypothetical protein